jgi:small subunit ribosomal protein S1
VVDRSPMAKKEPESFAQMFAREIENVPNVRRKRLAIGDAVEGVVAHISTDAVLVDLDAKQQGWFERMDLTGPDGALRVKVGDRLKGHVIAIDPNDQIQLGSSLGKDASKEQLRLAHEQGIPVEGKIVAINKGGAEVEIGGTRGFCPKSQLDVRFVEDLEGLVGQVFEFAIVEMKDRDVVLSRRRVLEARAKEARGRIEESLSEGATMRGRVTQVREFGAFVDIGGIEGLIPIREMSHDRVQRTEDVVSVGDIVEVKVTKLEKEGDRLKITLSLKALAGDPWEGIERIVQVGRVVAGQVTKVNDFGAFVRIASGVEGLLHVSEIGQRVEHAGDRVTVGEQMLLVVKEVDPTRRRISLALPDEGAKEGEVARMSSAVLGAVVTAKVEKHERFGVFVQLAGTRGRGGRALVPNAELGLRAGADVRKELPIGSEIKAKVVDATDGRIRLSVRAAHDDAERADYDTYKDAQAQKGGMGTLGDLLRRKLEQK